MYYRDTVKKSRFALSIMVCMPALNFVIANCGNLATIVENRSTLTIEYDYPALDVEGVSVTFSCSPGLMLSGPNASTCMRNGEWEPDPRDVECKG